MTSIGDGFFPVQVELDAASVPVAIEVTIQGIEDGAMQGSIREP